MAIAVDVMGGDFPVVVPVKGTIDAVNAFGFDVILVGDREQIHSELKKHRFDKSKVRIVHCSEVVEMEEAPAMALRQKKDSSIRVAVDLHKRGEADAVVSAGHSGAAMTTAKFVLKPLKGIDRPAIATVMPALKGSFMLLDIGANTDCKAQYLLQFAFMGDAYARTLLNLEHPRIALLSNGEEEGKGNAVVKETYKLLTDSSLRFVGNVEGKTMFKGVADVIVCDGFVGNISLKVAEGTFDFIQQVLRKEIKGSLLASLSYLGMKGPFNSLRKRADYTNVGGAPLLGVQGIVIICHGNSKDHTICNAVKHAQECARLRLNDTISQVLSANANLLQQANTLLETALQP
ncbi:phosphate acyltransferase PlsX [Deltaproteobacteria bacterium TL4]